MKKWLGEKKNVGSAKRLREAIGPETDPMRKEVAFQEEKRFKRLVDSERMGTSISEDIAKTKNFERRKNDMLKRETVNRKNNMKKTFARAAAKSLTRPPYIPLAGKKVFLHPDLDIALTREITKQNGIIVSDRQAASVYVAPNPAEPGQRVEICAILYGRSILQPEFVRSRGASGGLVCYTKAVGVRRELWVSPAWADRHGVLYNILETAVETSGSKWEWFQGDLDDYLKLPERRKVIGLVTPGDLSASQAWRM